MLKNDTIIPLVQKFTDNATAVAAKVASVQSFEDAVDYCVNLCTATSQTPVLAAPAFKASKTLQLESASLRHDITLVTANLREHLRGLDVGFTEVDYGIADTGTVVLNCPDENLRLATMVCDYHVCLLKKSTIVADSDSLNDQLNRYMQNTPNYLAFISGPSRTADIERVLTIGVHGPLELHILLFED